MTTEYGRRQLIPTEQTGASSVGVIDASTELVAAVGVVWHPTVKTGTINIRRVHFRNGALTLNAASVLRVSLQNISTTAGPPMQPDGTQDQTYDFAGTTVTFDNTTERVSWTSHGLAVDDVCTFFNSGGALPTGISAATTYWVKSVVDANTITLAVAHSLVPGGNTTLNITTNGTGTTTAWKLPANNGGRSGALSADRAVNLSSDSPADANSRYLAVVFEYQTFNTSDSFVLSSESFTAGVSPPVGLLLNTGSWASQARQASVALECDDGTLAYLTQSTPWSNASATSVTNAAAVRRAGMRFKVATTRSVDRIAWNVTLPNGVTGALVLYDTDGSTVLASIDIDDDCSVTAATLGYAEFCFTPVVLTAGSYYRFAFVPDTATAFTMGWTQYNLPQGLDASANLMDGFGMGQFAHWTQYDGAAWTESTIRRPWFDLAFSDYSAGGGFPVLGGPFT